LDERVDTGSPDAVIVGDQDAERLRATAVATAADHPDRKAKADRENRVSSFHVNHARDTRNKGSSAQYASGAQR
jgi:hypothetical protein